jgi:hypothetical protein
VNLLFLTSSTSPEQVPTKVSWVHWVVVAVRGIVAYCRTTSIRNLSILVVVWQDLGSWIANKLIDWMPSTEPPDDGAAEDIQESAEAALAATSQGI